MTLLLPAPRSDLPTFAITPITPVHTALSEKRKDGPELSGTTQPAATAAAHAGNGEDADEGQSHVSDIPLPCMRLGFKSRVTICCIMNQLLCIIGLGFGTIVDHLPDTHPSL